MDKRVDILIAGVQKAATTVLFKLLAQHPDIAVSSRKEPHFFDDETIDWRSPDYDRYHAFFAGADPAKLWLEATPIYSFWIPSLQRIAAYNPYVRLILSFRDPIERAYSHWRMEWARQWDTLDFQTAIRSGRDRLTKLPPLASERRIFSYVERGFYAEQVLRFLGRFRCDQLFFLSSHDLAADQEGTLRHITDWLGLAPLPAASMPLRANTDQSINYPSDLRTDDIKYLRNIYRHDLAHFTEVSGIDVTQWLTAAGMPKSQ